MFRIFKKKLNNQRQKGMTLIELLVALVIFSIITGIVLFNYGDFNASLTMQNLADDIALTVRRAQSYAIGVRGREGYFQVGYGVHFGVTPYDPADSSAEYTLYQGSNKSFILYKDDISGTEHHYTNTNNSCGGETSCLEMLYIKSSDYISKIGVKISGVGDVGYLGNDNPSGVSIFFKRPSPEPYIYVLGLGDDDKYWGIENGAGKPKIDYVKIEISSLKDPDSKKYITISNTGQISVSNQDD